MDLPKDVHTRKSYEAIMADRNHPLHEPQDVFTRVPAQELAAHYGQKSSQALGNAWRDTRGLVWGDIMHYKNALDAQNQCLALNDAKDKRRILASTSAIETDTVLQRLRSNYVQAKRFNYWFESQDQAKEKMLERFIELKAKTPMSGCHAPHMEQWLMLSSDFIDNENQYVPRVLPHLYPDSSGHEPLFFSISSSSLLGYFFATPLYFSGGEVVENASLAKPSLRCVCE